MNIHSILLSTAVIFLGSNAYSAERQSFESNMKIENDADGNFIQREKTTRVDAKGTSTITEKKLLVKVDKDGNTRKSTTTKQVVDPKGLGNRHVTKTIDSEETKKGETISNHVKMVNGKTVEGSQESYKAETKVRQDAEGNYKENDKISSTDASGTKVTYEKNAKVSVDNEGDVSKSTTTKSAVDPKGLGNKNTVTTLNTEKMDDGLLKSKQEVKVDGKTVQSIAETMPQ